MKVIIGTILIALWAQTTPVECMFNAIRAEEHQFTSVVKVNVQGIGTCSGTIIAPNCILTAAHCFRERDGIKPTKIWLYMGSSLINRDYEQILLVDNVKSSVHIHRDFNKNGHLENDIALIYAKGIKLNKNVTVAKLPTHEIPIESSVIMAGWGIHIPDGPLPHFLQWNTFQIYSSHHCHKKGFNIYDYTTVLCAGSSKSVACSGDSGGPLFKGDVVYGVISYLVEKCNVVNPVLCMDVFAYKDWILETIAGFK